MRKWIYGIIRYVLEKAELHVHRNDELLTLSIELIWDGHVVVSRSISLKEIVDETTPF